MSLDFSKTAEQIVGMTSELKTRWLAREQRLQNAITAMRELTVNGNESKREQLEDNLSWNVANALETPIEGYFPAQLPKDFRVVAVDGSHIATDRHLAARCFLVNVGVSILTYGSNPDAKLFNQPKLYGRGDEVFIRDKNTGNEQSIEGAILGAKRAVDEIQEIVRVIKDLPKNVPTLALIDGPLIMLSLSGLSHDSFVIRELVENGFVRALEELRRMSENRKLAVAGYISLPGSIEVINALRMEVCKYGLTKRNQCRSSNQENIHCEHCVGELRDREVLGEMLSKGERSGIFASSSSIVTNYYGDHGIQFFYVNTGHEIGRVEVPGWIGYDKANMDLVHSIIVDQCGLGKGYPVALMEAHEQATITASDRRYFVDLVERSLHADGLPVYTSEKQRSKRIRML